MSIGAKHKIFMQRLFVVFSALSLLIVNLNCAERGLVTDRYPIEFYHVPRLLPEGQMDANPTFIIYGDNRPDWRIHQKFIRRRNWATWKMLIFPFYQLYWLGNGVIGGINWLRYTPDYGVKERRMMRNVIYTEARRSKVDFIINSGDMPYDGRYPSHWETFLREYKVEKPLMTEFPYLPVTGNHERTNDPVHGLPNYQAIFGYPLFYVLDFPDAALFIVDTNIIIDQYQLIEDEKQEELYRQWFVSGDPESPAWLEREVAARQDKTFKFLVAHHPLISFGKHHSNWDNPDSGRNLPEKRQQLLRFFQQQGIQVVFCGHEHLYEHSVLRGGSGGNGSQDEVHLVVSGGGGVPLRDATDAETLEEYHQDYRDEGLDARLAVQEILHNYCLVEIDSDKATIQVFGVPGDAVDPLRLIDEIVVRKRR